MKQAMVVDNHPVVRKFMSDLLGKKGFEVKTAEDGLTALETLDSYRPDLVFIDLVMPNISGDKLCQIIRRRSSLKHCFIVVLSAIAMEKFISPEELEADTILAKGPFEKLSSNIDYVISQLEAGGVQNIRGRIFGCEDLLERQITKELLSSKKHAEKTLNHMSDGLIELVKENRIVYANPAALSIIDMPEEDLLGADFAELFQKQDRELVKQNISEAGCTRSEKLLDKTLGIKNKLVSVKILPVQRENSLCTLLVMLRDVTREKKAEEDLIETREQYRKERNFLENIFENSADAIAIVDRHGRFTRWNRQASRLFGYRFPELKNKKAFEFYADKEAMERMLEILRSQGSIQNYEIDFTRKDGSSIPCALSISLLTDEKGEKAGSLSIIRDLTPWKRAEEKLKYLSFHDSLTGLYNRAFFEEEMSRLAQGRQLPLGIIVCDVNSLKLINDTLGHQKGDELLKAAAALLKNSFRAADIIARIGGDEFAVLLPKSGKEVVKNSVERIKNEMKRYNEKNIEPHLSLSLGCAVRNEHPLDMQALFQEADDQMYTEKLNHLQAGTSLVLQPLINSLGTKDYLRHGHAERLQDYTRKLASAYGLSEEKTRNLELLAKFHDIGKVGISDSILFKPEKLTREETQEVRRHCEIGYRIALSNPYLAPIADLILKHHEWWDGRGYPVGLKGEEIPIECRILAVADAYDNMTNQRPYKHVKSRSQAVEELKLCAGIQFDPDVVDKFVRIIEESGGE